MLTVLCESAALAAQTGGVTLERQGATIVLEPYAPNIVRVTMSTMKDNAMAGPGYGIVAKPDAAGWSHQTTAAGDTYKSDSPRGLCRTTACRRSAGQMVHSP